MSEAAFFTPHATFLQQLDQAIAAHEDAVVTLKELRQSVIGKNVSREPWTTLTNAIYWTNPGRAEQL